MSKFDGALAKVARAEQHLDEVDRLGKAWAETVSYELRLELGGPNELVGRLFNPGNTTPPRRLALAFGDVVHNLRSALDHLVFELAVAGGASGERSEYPIVEDESLYRRHVDRALAGVSAADQARIESTQPYHLRDGDQWRRPADRDDPLVRNAILRLVRRLDNQDKHRLILEGVAEGAARQPTFRGVRAAEGTYPGRSIPLLDGSELSRVKSIEPINDLSVVQVGYRPAFTVIVRESGTEDGIRAGAGTLRVAANVIREVIGLFDSGGAGSPVAALNDPFSGPNSVIEWSGSGASLKVGVHVDLALRRRHVLEFWPEVFTAIEQATDLASMWAGLERAGTTARFAVRLIRRNEEGSDADISVELFDPTGDLDVWVGAIMPVPEAKSATGIRRSRPSSSGQ